MKPISYNTVLPVNISHIIEERGLKQCAVAKKAGYSIQTFNAMLNGRRIIKPIDVLAIATALDVTPNDLFAKSTNTEESA